MAEQIVSNDVFSTLAAGIDSTITSLTVATGDGAKFPSAGTFRVRVDDEILSCTSRAGDVLTIVRATEAVNGVTAAAAHSLGAVVDLVFTRATQDAFLKSDESDTMAGDLTFSGTARRIKGDLSNATTSDRLMIVPSTDNQSAGLVLAPTGTGGAAIYVAHGGPDPANSEYIYMRADSATGFTAIKSSKAGTGTARDLQLDVDDGKFVLARVNSVEKMRWPAPIASARHSANQSFADSTLTNAALDTDVVDYVDLMHFTSSANLTGTVSKTNGSASLTGSGTAFTTELSVGQAIDVPGTATERRVVTAIASNTSVTVSANYANTASGQTAVRVNGAIVIRLAGIYVTTALGRWAASGTGGRSIIARLRNGQDVLTSLAAVDASTATAGGSINQAVASVPTQLALWDMVELWGLQNSGGALDFQALTPRPGLGVWMVGE